MDLKRECRKGETLSRVNALRFSAGEDALVTTATYSWGTLPLGGQ